MIGRCLRASFWTVPRIASVLGLAAGVLVLATLADPGITVDEPLDVRPGRNYVAALRRSGLGFFRKDVVDRVFLDNKEHPPLGRWLLGIASTLGEPIEIMALGGPDPVGIYVVSGRLAPAIVFAFLVAFIAAEAGRRFGPSAAFASGFGLIVMPRVFAHAHLGALDLLIAAAWSVAFLTADRAIESKRPLRLLTLAGLVWGLALLIKIQAWLLPPILMLRVVLKLGWKRGSIALASWIIVGLLTFFGGWPWLWYDTLARLKGYLGTGVDRAVIYVEYFGQIYRDRDVPWHFPWVYFAVTVPVGLQLLGMIGTWRSIRERNGQSLFIVATIVTVLCLFSSNVPVYDGERLFLLVFPLWAILIGQGFAWFWTFVQKSRGWKLSLIAVLLAQSLGLILIHPFNLSYYNLFVGGLPGAERLGLEIEYWSESVDRALLDQLARAVKTGDSACLAPTLAPEQGKINTSRNLLRRSVVLGDEQDAEKVDWIVIYRRSAYWKDPIRRLVDEGEVLASRSRQGVWLSRIVRRLKGPTPPVHRADNS